MKTAVIVFPGTNCDRDTFRACEYLGFNPEFIRHDETNLNDFNFIILPGGFAYGDYIRAGCIAKLSPVINAVKNFVTNQQGAVLGICNGFQILCETALLEGALVDNECASFICSDEKMEFSDTEIILPIAHSQGKYYADSKTLTKLENDNMVFLKYKNNPNGSLNNIAGIIDRKKRIIAMMPHPERAVFKELGLTDGIKIFDFIKKELL